MTTSFNKWKFSDKLENIQIRILDDKSPFPWYEQFIIEKESIWQLKIDSTDDITDLLDLNEINYSKVYNFFEDRILYSFTNEEDLNIAKLLL